jgi:hypothetical protein
MKRKSNVIRLERDPGTPETQAKLDPDWILDLNPDQQYALDRIRAAYNVRTKETRVRMFDPNRGDRSVAPETPGEVKLQSDYAEWWKRCAGRGWGMARIHGLIVDPMTTRQQVAPVLGLIERALNEYLRIG